VFLILLIFNKFNAKKQSGFKILEQYLKAKVQKRVIFKRFKIKLYIFALILKHH